MPIETLITITKEERLAFIQSIGSEGGYDALYDASPKFKKDKKSVLLAVKDQAKAFEWASKELQKDEDVVIATLSKMLEVLDSLGYQDKYEDYYDDNTSFIPAHLINKESVIKGVLKENSQYYEHIKYFHKDEKMTLFAIKNGYPGAFFDCDNSLKVNRNFLKKVLSIDAECLSYMSTEIKNDSELVNIAMGNHPRKTLNYMIGNFQDDMNILETAFRKNAVELDVFFRYKPSSDSYNSFLKIASTFKESIFVEALKNMDIKEAIYKSDELPSIKSKRIIDFVISHIDRENLKTITIKNDYLKEIIDRGLIMDIDIKKSEKKNSRKISF